jgi:hypothetical protein
LLDGQETGQKMKDRPMSENVRLEVRVSPDFLEAVDNWRRRQPQIPSRSQAIQVLVAVAIIASDATQMPPGTGRGALKTH